MNDMAHYTPDAALAVAVLDPVTTSPPLPSAPPSLLDVVAAMRAGVVVPHRRDEELLRYYADLVEAAARREREQTEGYAAAMREALERILDIEGYGAPWIEAKCIAQKALEGQQCTPPFAQERPKIEQPGNAAAMRKALEELVYRKCLVQGSCGRPMDELCTHTGCIWHPYRAALSAPPRNCDRFANAAQALGAYPDGPQIGDEWGDADWMMFLDWLFAPEKGGAE